MRGLAIACTAVGSSVLGVLAAGWLVAVTPNPARSIPTGTYGSGTLPSTKKGEVVASAFAAPMAPMPSASPVPVESVFQHAQPPATLMVANPRRSSPPLLAAAKPTKASAPIIAVVKHRLAAAAELVLPPRHRLHDVQSADRRPDGVLTASEVERIRVLLRLSPDQEAFWPPVAEMLRTVGRRQMAASKIGETPGFGTSGDLMRFYFTAQPLLRSLRGDQKAEVRRLARRMGLSSVESYI